MASINVIQLSGHKEMIRALNTLDVKVQRRVLRQALRVGAKKALSAIKNRVPSGGELEGRKHLLDLIKLASRARRGRVTVGVAFPTREELGIAEDDPYYWPFAVEYGHASPGYGTYANKRTGKTGKKRTSKTAPKHTPPHPYIRTGWDAVESAIAGRLGNDILDGVAKEWTKNK